MKACPRCRVGRYKLSFVPFVHWIDDKPLMMPDMPASVCDVCGDMEYDPDVMLGVQYLIHQHEVRAHEAGKSARAAAASRHAPPLGPG